MIEIQIIDILSLFWKHNTFPAVCCKKTKKTAKQTSKQNKNKKEKKRNKGKTRSLAEFEPGASKLIQPHTTHTYAIEDKHMN